MADNKVKKSFATYLLILLLIVVAVFLIILVVMLFSPFKNILGFQYMLYNMDMNSADYRYTKTTGDELIDFSTIDEINVNCSYANVSVSRIIDTDVDAIGITNKCKGFARSSDNTDFNLEIYFEDAEKKVLNIEVQEPEGFLFFDKTIEIALLIPAKSDYALENTRLNINTNSGNIYIGNTHKLSENENETGFKSELKVNSLELRTNEGDIYLRSFIDSEFNDVYLRSNSGSIIMQKDIYYVSQSFETYTNDGDINLTKVSYNGSKTVDENIILYINNGEFSADTLSGNVGLNILNGYFNLNTLEGYITSNNSVEQMESASISIDYANGDVSLPFVNKSSVSIGGLANQKQAYIKATSGSINIGRIDGYGHIETTSGDIKVSAISGDINLKSTSGNIDLVYDSDSITSKISLSSTTGDIDLKVRNNFLFVAYFYDANNMLIQDLSNINIEFHASGFGNPFFTTTIDNPDGSDLTFTSNGHINISYI